MDFITNTLYSFKEIPSGNCLYRSAKNDSLLSFIHKDTRVFDAGELVSLMIDGIYIDYKIKNIIVHILSGVIPPADAIPYSYHVHINVYRYLP